jgi:hypothetical protein
MEKHENLKKCPQLYQNIVTGEFIVEFEGNYHVQLKKLEDYLSLLNGKKQAPVGGVTFLDGKKRDPAPVVQMIVPEDSIKEITTTSDLRKRLTTDIKNHKSRKTNDKLRNPNELLGVMNGSWSVGESYWNIEGLRKYASTSTNKKDTILNNVCNFLNKFCLFSKHHRISSVVDLESLGIVGGRISKAQVRLLLWPEKKIRPFFKE